MDALTPWHLALILLGFMMFFGYKKLPDATRSLGRSLRIFKSEVGALSDTDPKAGASGEEAAAPVDVPQLPASAAALEEQARKAEAEAAELRSRADGALGLARP